MECLLTSHGDLEKEQLSPHLQDIISKYKENFNGMPVAKSLKFDGEVTETDEE